MEDGVSLAFLGGASYDIKIVYDLDPAAELVLANRVEIAQVFVNLLRNAIEALRKCPPAGRRITIPTEALANEMVEVSVADTRPGLNLEMLDQLYMPFVSTKGDKGMGVGLVICRRIIEAHGGTLKVPSNPFGGAIFCFRLQNSCLITEVDE